MRETHIGMRAKLNSQQMDTDTQITTPLESAESEFRDALERRNRQLETTKEAIVSLANETAKVGVFAAEMRLLVGEKRFDVWFTERKFDCSLAAAKAFIKFSERRQEVTDNFRKTLLALPGIVEQSTREAGSQTKHQRAQCPWLSLLMKSVEAITVAREQVPLESWSESHRIALESALQPLAEIYNELCES